MYRVFFSWTPLYKLYKLYKLKEVLGQLTWDLVLRKFRRGGGVQKKTPCTWIYPNLPDFTWIFLNLPEPTWTYLNLPEFTWIYLNWRIWGDRVENLEYLAINQQRIPRMPWDPIGSNNGAMCGKAKRVSWWMESLGMSQGLNPRSCRPRGFWLQELHSPWYSQGFSTDVHSFVIPD